MSHPLYALGYIPDLADHRDKLFAKAGLEVPKKLLDNVDLRATPSGFPSVRNQGPLGACVGHGTRTGMLFANMMDGEQIDLSPLFIYFNGRQLEGTTNRDNGLMIRDGIKAVAKWGACPERSWPYAVNKFRTQPNAGAYSAAKRDQAITYYRVDNTSLSEMQKALASGYPIIVGATVYRGIYDLDTNNPLLPMPGANESPIGGHCFILCGYDNAKKSFLAQNSWGTSWGANGFFTVPYAYITDDNITSDCWVITKTN